MKYYQWMFASLFLVLGCWATADADARLERVLDDFDWRLEQLSITNDILSTPEAQAVLNEGVSMLPKIIQRYADIDELLPFSDSNYYLTILLLSGIRAYMYSEEPYSVHGYPFHDPNSENLPMFSVKRGREGWRQDRYERRRGLLELWEYLQSANNLSERRSQFDAIAGHVGPMAESFVIETWRAYERALINYGIFNLPVFIESVLETNNPVAFAEFLRLTCHTQFLHSEYRTEVLPIERVREAANEFSEHEERIAEIIEWWAGHAEQFEAFPRLKKEIEASLGAVALK